MRIVRPNDPDFKELLESGRVVSGADINALWHAWNAGGADGDEVVQPKGQGAFCCQRDDGTHRQTRGHRQCHSLLGFTRVGLDHRTNVDRRRRANGLHRPWIAMSAFGGKADTDRMYSDVRL
jgi:hypothetical protein